MIATGSSSGVRANDPDRGGPAAAAEETLKLLGKAVRAHQLYLSNNPTYHRALELLRRSFGPLWELVPDLTLQVTEHELVWEGRALYHEAERGTDALPWLLYKDGIRELRLLPGLEGDEIERLLEVIRLLGRAAGTEEDAITLLWDRDFAFLRYRFIEAASDESGEFRLAPAPGRLDGEAGAAGGTPHTVGLPGDSAGAAPVAAPAGVVSMQDFDAAPFFLAERELAYLRDGLMAEYAHDVHGDVVAMLLDTFEAQPVRRTRDEVCVALDELLLLALAVGNYRGVASLLREVGATLGRATAVADEHRTRLHGLGEQLSTADGLGRLTDALDVAETLPADAEIEALFSQLTANALGHLLGRLGTVQTPRLRAALRAAADRLALAHTAELARLVGHEDEGIALEAVQRAGALRTTAAVPALAGVLRGAGGNELRAAATRALAEIGSPGALQELAGVLDDRDREVRLAAARAAATHRFRGALAPLDAIVRERRVREADLTEQMAVFEAYGALCGEDGVAYLDGLLNGRSLLGRRQDPPMRACAAVALGRADTPQARAALARAADEKDIVVRAAVQRAIRGSA